MTMRLLAAASLVVLVLASAACSGPGAQALEDMEQATIESKQDAGQWAIMSAPGVLSIASQLIETFEPPAFSIGCPSLTEKDDRFVYEGGCTDDYGARFEGRLVFEKEDVFTAGVEEVQTGTMTFSNWTETETRQCDGSPAEVQEVYDGVIRIVKLADDRLEFELDLALTRDELDGGTCEVVTDVLAWDYRGDAVVDESSEQSTWNGAGQLGFRSEGKVSLLTEDELFDLEVCRSAAVSGTTTVDAGEDHAVVTYDGATDCDNASLVTVNGEDLGELVGLACATGAGSGAQSGAAGLLALLAFGGFVLRRRR